MEVKGKTAVVTGAGSGIGRSIALALAKAGANVVVADVEEDAAAEVAREIVGAGSAALVVATDVSQLRAVEALADAAYEQFGSVEVLVNNAGVTMRPFRASWDTSYEDFQWMMNVNFWGVLHGHQVFVPRMRATAGRKHIVNTSSTASLVSMAGHSAYAATKSAVDGFSNVAREELKTQNIGLTILHPGPVRTRVAASERLRPAGDRSDQRGVKPWTDYSPPDELYARVINAGAADGRGDPDQTGDPGEYITPTLVGGWVVQAIERNLPHVLTHPAPVQKIQKRVDEAVAGYLGRPS